SALVNDAAERATDSPLVRAAKRSLAARTRIATQVVIDDQYLRATGGGHYAQAVGTLPPISTAADNTPRFVPPSSPVQKDTRAIIEKKVQELKVEQRNLADEADQGPYGEIGEDVVGARMTQNQNEQQNLQQQLNSNQPRPSRPPQ
ncbi:MAG: hypothetical protein ACXVJT_12480, partial [Thermoanaerobaculia bacterium]